MSFSCGVRVATLGHLLPRFRLLSCILWSYVVSQCVRVSTLHLTSSGVHTSSSYGYLGRLSYAGVLHAGTFGGAVGRSESPGLAENGRQQASEPNKHKQSYFFRRREPNMPRRAFANSRSYIVLVVLSVDNTNQRKQARFCSLLCLTQPQGRLYL